MKYTAPAIALVAALTASSSFADAGVEIGVLTCKLQDVDNNIVYTKETFSCEFAPKEQDIVTYSGVIQSVGVDLQVKKDTTLVWGVIAPTEWDGQQGALRGTYVGGSAEVSLVGGVGAKVLVGGFEDSFTLQPISVSGIVGGGASVGIQKFELR